MTHEKLLRSTYEAFAAQDMAALDAIFADDVAFHVHGDHAMAGEYRSKEELFGFFARLGEKTGGTLRVDVNDIVANDRHAIGLVTVTAQRPGKHLEVDAAQIHRIEDGQITEAWPCPATCMPSSTSVPDTRQANRRLLRATPLTETPLTNPLKPPQPIIGDDTNDEREDRRMSGRTKNRNGTRRSRLASQLAVLAVLAALLIGAGPEQPTIHHVPAPAAPASVDHELAIAVSGSCWVFCNSYRLTVRYHTGGDVHRITQPLSRWQPAQVTTVTLPAEHLHGDELRYWITTTQRHCYPLDRCFISGDRHPTAGSHRVQLIDLNDNGRAWLRGVPSRITLDESRGVTS